MKEFYQRCAFPTETASVGSASRSGSGPSKSTTANSCEKRTEERARKVRLERAEPQGPNPSPEISEVIRIFVLKNSETTRQRYALALQGRHYLAVATREAPLIADAPHPPDALITCRARFIVGCRSGYVIYRVFWLLGPQAGAGALSGGPPWRLNVDFRIAVAKDIFDEGKRDYGAVFAQDGASAAAAAAAAPVKIVRYVGLSTEEKLPEQRHKRGFVSSPSVHSIAFAL